MNGINWSMARAGPGAMPWPKAWRRPLHAECCVNLDSANPISHGRRSESGAPGTRSLRATATSTCPGRGRGGPPS
jgi:hypothetical protein